MLFFFHFFVSVCYLNYVRNLIFFIYLSISLSSPFLKIAISDSIHAILSNVLDLEIASICVRRREQCSAHDFLASVSCF